MKNSFVMVGDFVNEFEERLARCQLSRPAPSLFHGISALRKMITSTGA